MAVLTADRQTPCRGIINQMEYPVATNIKIYSGAKVALNSGGFAVAAADAASYKVVGVCKKFVDNTGGANGAKTVIVETGLFEFNATSITQAMVGTVMYVVDDNTFDDALGTNGIKAGVLVRYISTTSGEILILPSGAGVVTADAIDLATAVALANALKTAVNVRIL